MEDDDGADNGRSDAFARGGSSGLGRRRTRERARALGELGNPDAAQHLATLVRYGKSSVGGGTGDPDSNVQLAAIEALGRLGGPHALEAFSAVLSNEPQTGQQPWVHQATVQALTQMAQSGYQKQAASELVRFLEEGGGEHPALFVPVIESLGQIGHPVAYKPLLGLLNFYADMSLDQRTFVRITKAFTQILAKSRDVGALVGCLLGSPWPDLREAAAAAIGALGGAEVVQALVTALADPWADVRQAAAEGLGRIGPDALPAVVSALRYGHHDLEREYTAMMDDAGIPNVWGSRRQEQWVREYATRALGKIGGEAAITELIGALNGDFSWVRPGAAEELGKLGGSRAIKALRNARRNADPIIQKAIDAALETAQRKP